MSLDALAAPSTGALQLSSEAWGPDALLPIDVPVEMSKVLHSIVVWAMELLKADAGEIFLYDEEKGNLIQSIGCGSMERYIGLILRPGEGIVGRVFQSGEPMIVPDYASWPGRLPLYVLENPTTDMTVPMTWQGRTIGVLGITADSRRRTFREEDLLAATLFANLAAIAISSQRLYEDLEDRATRLKVTLERQVAERTAELAHRALQLETSARVSRQVTSILDTEALVSSVVRLISQAFGYPFVHIYLREGDSQWLALRASTVSVAQEYHRLPFGPGSLNGTAAQTKQPLLVPDVSQNPHYLVGDEATSKTRSELVIPLLVGARVVGTLDVQSERLDAFSEDDILLFQSLGDQIAIAIENATLYDQSRRLAALEERSYLARELHDSVTQLLFSVTLTAEAARMLLAEDPGQVEAQLDRLQLLAHQAMNEMRALIHQMRPDANGERSFAGHIRSLVAEREKRDGLQTTLHIEGEQRLPARAELALFRIVQEALNNVVKHAQVDTAEVTLRYGKDSMLLLIEDQGLGFDPSHPGRDMPTLGLTSMRERAELLGGVFAVESAPGCGTRIRVQVPAAAQE